LEGLLSRATLKVRCRCGAVVLTAIGKPILVTVCGCSSCGEAGRILEKLPGAPPILDGNSGTPFVLFCKNRVECVSGGDRLREHRLEETSPTRRVLATCCNSFMFLDFTQGHWITLARDRIEDAQSIAGAPKVDRDSGQFLGRLVFAWVAMGFRRPTIDFVSGKLDTAAAG